MFLLAWRPRQVALLRLVVGTAIAIAIGALAGGVLGPEMLTPIVIIAVLLALSGDRAEVFRLGSPNLLLLAVTFVAAIPLVVEALRQADLQGGVMTGDEHHELLHFAGMAIAYLAVVIGGAWSAFPGRAVRTARILVGLGGATVALASMAFPDAPSAVGSSWAVGGLLASVVYLAMGEVASRAEAEAV
jgi:hypothetical protein